MQTYTFEIASWLKTEGSTQTMGGPYRRKHANCCETKLCV